jgi:hypothetical protein
MIPGIPNSIYGDINQPTCEINDKWAESESSKKGISLAKREEERNEYVPLKNALDKQGLKNDKLRGFSTSGSKRESPSMCYGILSPLGNSFVMDDGWTGENFGNWKNDPDAKGDLKLKGGDGVDATQLTDETRYNAGFRLRTRNGTQLLISDSGTIYMINKDGTAWAEITDDGRLQGYAKNSADIACDGDINLHSKQKIRMEADDGFVFKSKNGGLSFDVKNDVNISASNIITDNNIKTPVIYAKDGVIENFNSKNATCDGKFSGEHRGNYSGILIGSASYATFAGGHDGEIPVYDITSYTDKSIDIPDLNLEKEQEIDGKDGEKQKSVNTCVPTAEPYDGHNRNDKIPDLVKKIQENDLSESSSTESASSSEELNNISNNCQQVCPNKTETSDPTIPEQQLTEHYTLNDLCYSSTAISKGLSNAPSSDEIGNLKSLAENVLEKVYEHYNGNVHINSCYRGKTLNSVIGGATSSQHCSGSAADIEVPGVSNLELANWIKDNLDYDQLILEYADNIATDPNSGWVHVSYKKIGPQRNQCLTINKSGTKLGF